MVEIVISALRTAVLVSGLVVIMMMLIESLHIESHGKWLNGLRASRTGQVLVSALLGSVPGCLGGFASVSLYTHKMLGFGALLAMLIATAGDEAFLMLALFPQRAVLLFAILLALGIGTGLLMEFVVHPRTLPTRLDDTFETECCEKEEQHPHAPHSDSRRHWGWHRIALLLGVVGFLAVLLSGHLEDAHELDEEGFHLFDEIWLYWLFAALSLVVVGVLLFGSDHFLEEHLWHHIVCHHLPSIFAWTFGMLLGIGLLFHFIDLQAWISGNTGWMILLAIAVGLIPESGPHLVFVTLFASGVIPFPVLLANSIVQEGHAALPLLAESKGAFLRAKALKVALALVVGYFSLFIFPA